MHFAARASEEPTAVLAGACILAGIAHHCHQSAARHQRFATNLAYAFASAHSSLTFYPSSGEWRIALEASKRHQSSRAGHLPPLLRNSTPSLQQSSKLRFGCRVSVRTLLPPSQAGRVDHFLAARTNKSCRPCARLGSFQIRSLLSFARSGSTRARLHPAVHRSFKPHIDRHTGRPF